jgi:hypothetical protein
MKFTNEAIPTFTNSFIATVKSRFTRTKIGRLLNSYIHPEPVRIGQCTPDMCETLDGKRGAACCRLGNKCLFLKDSSCDVYQVRLRNCKVFPNHEDDLKLIKNCGYRID